MKVLILIFCIVALSETTVAANSVQSLKSRTHSFCFQILNYFSGGKAIEESPRLTYRKQIMSQKLPRFKDIFNEEKYAVPAGRNVVHLFLQRNTRPISREQWLTFMHVNMSLGVEYIQAKWPSISQSGQIWTYMDEHPNNDWPGVAMTIRDEYRFFDIKNKKHMALWQQWSSSDEGRILPQSI